LFFKKEVLYFNPGSCGPRRFQLPMTVGLLTISDEGEFDAKLIAIDCV
jgi:hypothetical protein